MVAVYMRKKYKPQALNIRSGQPRKRNAAINQYCVLKNYGVSPAAGGNNPAFHITRRSGQFSAVRTVRWAVSLAQ